MSEPMRVLHVLGCLNREGAETMIMNLYRNINRTEIQFDFIVHVTDKCDYDDEILEMGGRIYRIPHFCGKNYFQYKKAWSMFFESHPEYKIIHGHLRSTASIYLSIAKKYGRITIAHSHSTSSRGNMPEQFIKNILQLPIRHIADYLFACSDEAGKWLFGEKSIKANNYKVIKNAINIEKYAFDEDKRNKMRKDLNIQNKFGVGHVGSFTPPKNHKFLIEIFYEICRKNENALLLLIGDGELRMQIEKQIEALLVQDKIILTGIVSNVNDYMQAMDVLVFPSIFEGLPLAIVEAQASGLPCIISDAITDEVRITSKIRAVSLSKRADEWADIAISVKTTERANVKHIIEKSGFDIRDTVEKLSLFYESIERKENL